MAASINRSRSSRALSCRLEFTKLPIGILASCIDDFDRRVQFFSLDGRVTAAFLPKRIDIRLTKLEGFDVAELDLWMCLYVSGGAGDRRKHTSAKS